MILNLQLLRHLHPDRVIVREDEMLDSSNRKWRRKAEASLGLQEVCIIFYFINLRLLEPGWWNFHNYNGTQYDQY